MFKFLKRLRDKDADAQSEVAEIDTGRKDSGPTEGSEP